MEKQSQQLEIIGISRLNDAPEIDDPKQPAFGVNPFTSGEALLYRTWSTLLGQVQIGLHDNFFELGGTSLLAAQMLAEVGQKFGRKLALPDFFREPTLAHLTQMLKQQGVEHPGGPVVALQAQGTKRPLFMVPGGLGEENDLAVLARWVPHLGSDQPFYGLVARPEQAGAEQPRDIARIAASYLQAIRTTQASGPYLLGGDCIGGLVAYEMAQQLCRAGERVALLALFDTYPPSRAFYWRWRFSQSYLGQALSLSQRTLRYVRQLPQIRASERRAFVQTKARNAAKVVQEAAHLSQHSDVLLRYRLQPYPGCIRLFATDEVAKWPNMNQWHTLAAGGLNVEIIPGAHGSYHTTQTQPMVARLRFYLDKAQGEG